MKELTKHQIERQDFVDNAIFELLLQLNPTDKIIDWDIEMIAEVRDAVAEVFSENDICKEEEFY